MVMPAIMIAIGTAIISGSFADVGEKYSQQASNFYSFIGIICVLIFLCLFQAIPIYFSHRQATKVSDNSLSVDTFLWHTLQPK